MAVVPERGPVEKDVVALVGLGFCILAHAMSEEAPCLLWLLHKELKKSPDHSIKKLDEVTEL